MLTAFAILTDALVYAAYLFVVAIGLTLIFGVMKILNVAHGAFYAFGAYGAATAVGIYFDRGLPVAGGFLILEDVIILVWGPGTYAAYQPLAAAGSIAVGNLVLSGYDIGLVGFAAIL